MKARIINAIIWVAIAAVASTMVCVEWYKSGCEWWQLTIAIVFYAACCFGVGSVIDQTIYDRNNDKL